MLAERYLAPYSLEVVDVRNEPEKAMEDGVLVTPTLVRLGEPALHIIGNLSDTAAVLASLAWVASRRQPMRGCRP